MRIDKTEMIAGQPILRVRDFLRSIGDNGFTDLEIAHRFKVSQGGAAEILRELRARSWVEPREEHEPGWYEVSMRGRALAAARAVPPISRMAAELLMKRFLERVSDVNGRDELTHRVTEVRVFGSYLTSAPFSTEVGAPGPRLSDSCCAPTTSLRAEIGPDAHRL